MSQLSTMIFANWFESLMAWDVWIVSVILMADLIMADRADGILIAVGLIDVFLGFLLLPKNNEIFKPERLRYCPKATSF